MLSLREANTLMFTTKPAARLWGVARRRPEQQGRMPALLVKTSDGWYSGRVSAAPGEITPGIPPGTRGPSGTGSSTEPGVSGTQDPGLTPGENGLPQMCLISHRHGGGCSLRSQG